ncbi:UDP-glucosyltransferase 29-like [Telopea speciosissima]|uniref:UDP-glucosyltransferase 29-like n=1 Tax=Telopea speciosissima TaxID=54955 RepID=UPI001CC3FF4D|nr:UDP-glucosyltransferase 29-like [Telopea speciosissima]
MKPGVEFPFQAIYLHEHEEVKISEIIHSSSNGIRDMDWVQQSMNRSWSFILIKTFREIEAKYIDYTSSLLGKEFIPMGPLVQEPLDHDDDHFHITIEWLKEKDRSSVIFVSFGSEYFFSKEEMEEMAQGLDLGGMDFIWVVRFPPGIQKSLSKALPQWFLDRVVDGEKGLVVEGWAPQVVGGSELGVGVEVKRSSGGDGKFQGEEVAKGIREVVDGRNGEEVKRRVEEMREKMTNMGEMEMDAVAKRLVQLCRSNYIEDGLLLS